MAMGMMAITPVNQVCVEAAGQACEVPCLI